VIAPEGVFFVFPESRRYPEGNPYNCTKYGEELRAPLLTNSGRYPLLRRSSWASVVSSAAVSAAVHTIRTGALRRPQRAVGIAVVGAAKLSALSPYSSLHRLENPSFSSAGPRRLQQDRGPFQAQDEEVAEEHRRLRAPPKRGRQTLSCCHSRFATSKRIVDAGRRFGASWERDTADVEEAAERQIAEDSSEPSSRATNRARRGYARMLQSEQERDALVSTPAPPARARAGPTRMPSSKLTAGLPHSLRGGRRVAPRSSGDTALFDAPGTRSCAGSRETSVIERIAFVRRRDQARHAERSPWSRTPSRDVGSRPVGTRTRDGGRRTARNLPASSLLRVSSRSRPATRGTLSTAMIAFGVGAPLYGDFEASLAACGPASPRIRVSTSTR